MHFLSACTEDQRRHTAFVNFIFRCGVHKQLGFIVSPDSFLLSRCAVVVFVVEAFFFFPDSFFFLFFFKDSDWPGFGSLLAAVPPIFFWYALDIARLPAYVVWTWTKLLPVNAFELENKNLCEQKSEGQHSKNHRI